MPATLEGSVSSNAKLLIILCWRPDFTNEVCTLKLTRRPSTPWLVTLLLSSGTVNDMFLLVSLHIKTQSSLAMSAEARCRPASDLVDMRHGGLQRCNKHSKT